MAIQVADAHAHVQRLVSVVKMVTALSILPRNSVLLCVFLWAKGPNAKDIQKEILPVYGGKCLSLKAIHNCIEKFS
jgi:hypothetical protein